MIGEREKVYNLHEREVAVDTGSEQIEVFLRRCDELMQARFIIADTKIGELLKAIASSDLLYAFFRDVTKTFDYTAAQEKYLDYAPYGSSKRRKLLFPEDEREKLAFIFCLLVEFDSKKRDLSTFLQEYFYEDGSVYESFYAFTNQVIKPFRNSVKRMFRNGAASLLNEPFGVPQDFSALVNAERDLVFASALADEEKVNALFILNALMKTRDETVRAGLLSGYRLFVRLTGWNSVYVQPLLQNLEEIRESL